MNKLGVIRRFFIGEITGTVGDSGFVKTAGYGTEVEAEEFTLYVIEQGTKESPTDHYIARSGHHIDIGLGVNVRVQYEKGHSVATKKISIRDPNRPGQRVETVVKFRRVKDIEVIRS